MRSLAWIGLVCAGMVAAAASMCSGQNEIADLGVIKNRLYSEFVAGGVDVARVKGYVASQQADGSWADLNYADKARTGWQPTEHVMRIVEMALAYRRDDSPLHNDADLKAHIMSALDCWAAKDPICVNWWYNEIGVPMQMERALFLMEPDLSPERMAAGYKVLERAKIGMTGQNLVDVSQITIGRACLQGDGDLCAKAFAAIANEIRVTTKEGIQHDMSFHQHGAQLYNGGYGLGFSIDCAHIAALAAGTRFAFPKEKIDILSNYILDGQQWMFRGDVMDYSVQGRGITRVGLPSRAIISACQDMIKLATPRRKEFEAFIRTLKGEDPPGAVLIGNKHFWRSDFMVHRRKAYNASVRMASKRMRRTEVVNSEGLKSDHLSDGLTYVYVKGDEYEGIFPVWDWRKLPGITCLQGDRPFTPSIVGMGKYTFVGGASDGMYGCAAFDFAVDGVTAKKAWFFFDDEIVCLGSGITCAAEDPVVTTLNQCRLRGDVTVCDATGTRKLDKGDRSLDGVKWIYHDSIGYLFPQPASLHVKNDAQMGSWKGINAYQSPDPVSMDVFSAWIDHGAKPTDASYEYILLPGAGLDGMANCIAGNMIKVISNTTDLQAAMHKRTGVVEIAFWKAGRMNLDGKDWVAVDQPCLLVTRKVRGGTRIAVADPTGALSEVNVETSLKLDGEGVTRDKAKGCTSIHFTLPTAGMAGSSVVREFQ